MWLSTILLFAASLDAQVVNVRHRGAAAPTGPTFQHVFKTATTSVVSDAINVPSGATVVVAVGANATCSGVSFGTVTGTGGDSFTQQDYNSQSFACAASWVKTGATANASYVVTVNLGSVSWASAHVFVAVIPSTSSVADHKANFASSGATNTLPTMTATGSGTLVTFLHDYYASDTFAVHTGTGLTGGTRVSDGTGASYYTYRTVTAGTYAPAIDITGSSYTIHLGVIVQ